MAKASGEKEVSPGQIVEAQIDCAMINEITGGLTAKYFHEIGAKRVWDKDKVVIVLDHTIPAPNPEAAELHRVLRNFAREMEIPGFYDVGRGGVCHQVVMEKGYVKPGDVIVGADSHTTTYGALGAFSTGIGSTEMTAVFVTGRLWFKVPRVFEIRVDGGFSEYVTAKDLFLKIAGDVGAGGATYRGIEFTGETIRDMDVSGRMTLCNMAVEVGAKAGIVEPDAKTVEYVSKRSSQPYPMMKSDPGSSYEKTLHYSVDRLAPMVACPNAVDNVKPVSEVEGVELDQVVVGSCTNGRIEDLRVVASILESRTVSPRTRLIIIPASQEVYLDASKEELIDLFIKAGAAIATPSCGPCFGSHLGILASEEVCLSTTNRNFVGRMGDRTSKVYLASPATAAASAVTGKITDPRVFVRR